MSRYSVRWIVVGIGVLGLALLSLVFGVNLLPTRAVAQTKGTLGPWLLTWGIVWLAALSGLTLATFLIATGLGKIGRSD